MVDYFEPEYTPDYPPMMVWCTVCEENVMLKAPSYYDWEAQGGCPNCGSTDLDEPMED